ncbi:MAG: hypothetical protein M3Q27_12430 [Actinomycetota bacterium]|nr:hypothetical protein [Actinomycetota bacterium]
MSSSSHPSPAWPRPSGGPAAPNGTPAGRGAGWVAVVLHLAVGAPYLGSGLVASAYGVAVLWALWAVLLLVLVRLRVRRPFWALAVPVVAAVLWFVVLLIGDAALGWTA